MAEFTDNKILSDDEIVKNFEKFKQLCMKVGDDRVDAVKKMLDELSLRIASAPASTRRNYHAAYPGGLVDHSLRVAQYALTLKKTFSLFDIPVSSVLFASLFHDLGKVGGPGPDGPDYYVVETSEWHREKLGKYYALNDDVQYVHNVDYTMMIFLHYGIKPTRDEYLAIRLNDGPASDANKDYTMREPRLAILIQMADRLATEEEREMFAK